MNEPQTKICQNCRGSFTIEADDFSFYEKMKVPPPTWCPECRLIRRLMRRNERSLYKRICNLCDKEKISMFPQSSPYTVYCTDCWRSDNWDGMNYGRDYDFSKPFFAQWHELLLTTPRYGIIQQGENVDSEYTNRANSNRGCYHIFASSRNEYCRYGTWFIDSLDSMDCYGVQKSEQCYGCIDCFQCYDLLFSQECNTCRSSAFLFNCRNCTNCFGCVNMRNAKYCIFNTQYSKEEYDAKLKSYNLSNYVVLADLRNKFTTFRRAFIVPWSVVHHAVDSSGNWLEDCKNTRESFNCRDTEDVRYGQSLFETKDAMDFSNWGQGSERIYECINVGIQSAGIKFSTECWVQAMDNTYCMNCETSKNLFGCISLRKKQYCILNKQYSKEEYETLIPQIMRHMDAMPYADSKGRVYKYGEYYPPELCQFAYNESIAQEYFPLSKEQVIAAGYPWKDQEAKTYTITKKPEELPRIGDAQDSIKDEVIGCEHKGLCNDQCTTAFRIISDELQFYRKRNLPLPTLCPNCRHYERLRQRTPLKLWHRSCRCAGKKSVGDMYQNTASHFHGEGHCPNKFETSYAPDRPEIVYCEQCYQAEVA